MALSKVAVETNLSAASWTEVWRARVPALPETTSVNVPRWVNRVVRTVSVAEPGEPTGFGLSVAVTPAGMPATDRVTGPTEPPTTETATV